MFITLDDELQYDEYCYNKLSTNLSIYRNLFLNNNNNYDNSLSECKHSFTGNPNCPNIGFASYLFLFTFFILLKLILLNILSAMFSSSLVTYDKQTIWRFQRFNLIMFFTLTSPFPPPFTFIYYIYLIYLKFKNLNSIKKDILNNKYCPLCCDLLNNHFWNRISSNIKIKISNLNDNNLETKQNDIIISQQLKMNELNKNLVEIKKVLFQLDIINVDLNEKEIISKLKWITKK